MWDRHTTKDLSCDRVREVVDYDPETGKFVWKKRISLCVTVGQEAGCKKSDGYIYITIDGVQVNASRLAFLYMEGYFPETTCDHIDRVRDNNRWKNLREASFVCNTRNASISKNNTSGVVGVSYNKNRDQYESHISVNSKKKHLGWFGVSDFVKAVMARWNGEKKYNYPKCCTTSSAYTYLKSRGVM